MASVVLRSGDLLHSIGQEYRLEGGEEVGLLRLRAEGGSGPAGWWSWCLSWEVYFSGCVVLCGD